MGVPVFLLAFLLFDRGYAAGGSIFDEWSGPRKSGAYTFKDIDDIVKQALERKKREAATASNPGGAKPDEPVGPPGASSDQPPPPPRRKKKKKKSLPQSFLDKMKPFHRSRERSKRRFNVSIGNGDGEHPLSNIVHNDEVVVGRLVRGGLDPDSNEESQYMFTRSSTGGKLALIERCKAGRMLLSGGCSSPGGVSAMRPHDKAFVCRGEGKKKISAICADPGARVYADRRVERVEVEAGKSRGEVRCWEGYVVSGGGCDFGTNSKRTIVSNVPRSNTTWRCEADGPVEADWMAYAVCVKGDRNIKITYASEKESITATCPAAMKLIGGGCHVKKPESGPAAAISQSAPHISGGWSCKARDSAATLFSFAICGDFSDLQAEQTEEAKESTSGLIAPSFYSSLILYVSHGIEGAESPVYLKKPIVTTPGDDSPGALATVSWGHGEGKDPSQVVPYARTSHMSELFDDDEEFVAEVEDSLQVSINFRCLAEGVVPMLMVFQFFSTDDAKGYERITLALHKNCTGSEDLKAAPDTDFDLDAEFDDLSAAPAGAEGEGEGEGAATGKREFSLPDPKAAMRSLRIGISQGGAEVVEHGKVNPRWSKASKQAFTIKAEETQKNFYFSLERESAVSAVKLLGRPVVFTDNSSVVTPSVSEFQGFGGFNRVDREHPSVVTVGFECHGPGAARVAVVVQLEGGATVHFQFAKRCPRDEDAGVDVEAREATPTHKHKRQRRQGHYIKGFMVGSSKGGGDVIEDGWLQPEYFLPDVGESLEDSASVVRRRARIIPYATHNVTFYLGLNHEMFPLRYSRPTVVADSADSRHPIAFPELYGSFMVNTKLENRWIYDLTVTFNCLREGIADIIVTLPVGKRPITFAFRKACQQPPESFKPKIIRVNGLNVGSLFLDDVVKDGKPLEIYSWSTDSDGLLAEVGPEIPVSRFVISREIPQDSREQIVFEEPTITPHRNDIIEPEVGKGTPPPFTLTAEKPAAKVRFMYHCKRRGSTVVTIALPWMLLQPSVDRASGEEKVQRVMGTIHLHLIKTCRDPHAEVTRDEGGLDLPGFHIGYKRFSSNVVRDGYPTRHYFGQRNKINPDWKAITVPKDTRYTSFYVSYSKSPLALSKDGTQQYFFAVDDGSDDFVQFDIPMIHSHDAIARPRLMGEASRGMRLGRGRSADITIVWNCVLNGTTSASVRIPIYPSGFVTYTVPKECDGKHTLADLNRAEELRSRGMYVSTEFEEDETKPMIPNVVTDGHTLDQFSTYKSGKRGGRYLVNSFEQSTLFFLWYAPYLASLGTDKFQYLNEPMIFAHRPICNPSLEHNLDYQQSTPSLLNPDGMTLTIDELVRVMNVTYNCVWEGETAITVVIPLVNRGKISFTWTKMCSEAEYDQFIPHCVQYKTPEESETILGAMWEYVTSFTVAPEQETVHVQCERCEDGYVVVEAEDFPELDVDGNYLPPARYKRDECVRNSSHFGFEDESFDNMDTHHLEDDLAGNMPLVGEVDNNEGWHEHDEVSWKAHDSVADGGQTALMNVGTKLGGNDVVQDNVASRMYALQGGDAAVVGSSVEESVFYISARDSLPQKLGYPSVKTRLLEGENSCSAEVDGDASRGGVVRGAEGLELKIKYKCERPGATAVLVVVPVQDSTAISFRVVKLCKGYQTRADRAW
eukprot:CAMPEP_0114507162 /NCGR_PEP_ID=MMETSP0109-20121206/11856_1 /TAXON_ID=29199 /ORGANISM="Chlorarachnion reptans, Strain CCCM449" /LENGTH=1656 /DNA_ID=CAMNT_0001685883 /DNA_START=136 /DNA_END=5103 /DNA_ORIENTATION=-